MSAKTDWMRQLGIDEETAESMIEWCRERIANAQNDRLPPILPLQTTLLCYMMLGVACNLEAQPLLDLIRDFGPTLYQVARQEYQKPGHAIIMPRLDS